MRGGALPPALLAAAFGLMLAFGPRRTLAAALAVFTAAALGATLYLPAPQHTDAIFLACWISIVACSLAVHWPNGLSTVAVLSLAANAGIWAGGVVAVGGEPFDLLKALPWCMLAVPASWLVDRARGIAVKVVASWLAAVALLAAALPFVTPTPGYVADHME